MRLGEEEEIEIVIKGEITNSRIKIAKTKKKYKKL
jgi:hypothetical protein